MMKRLTSHATVQLLILQMLVKESDLTVAEESCLDHRGQSVVHGDRYFPLGTDPCTQCTCLNGKPEMCISVFCSPPENCRQYHALNDKCCEFVCLDGSLPNLPGPGSNTTTSGNDGQESLNATNLGLRLVASTVTSFLILALLLFMIHRLRQRRLLLMIRRLQGQRPDTGGNTISRHFSLDDDATVGYFVGHDQIDFSQYEEPPPPYCFWKPPESYIPPGEAPPPYEVSLSMTAPPYNAGGFITVSETTRTSFYNCTPDLHEQRTASQMSLGSQASDALPAQQQQQQDEVDTRPSESISTISMASVPDSEVLATRGDNTVIRSDARYEDLPIYMANNVTVLHIGNRDQEDTDHLHADDVVNGNVPGLSSEVAHRPLSPDNQSCTCMGSKGAGGQRGVNRTCQHKVHSYSDFIDYWQHRVITREGEFEDSKRFSLQAMVNGQNNNFFPDPTSWTGEGSESSTSSSPTYEQRTLSPSTSDSSSMEVDFSLDPRLQRNSMNCAESLPAGTGPVGGTRNGTQEEGTGSLGKYKNSSLDRTLQQLKKFSLTRRKKRKKKAHSAMNEEAVVECTTTLDDGSNLVECQNCSDANMLWSGACQHCHDRTPTVIASQDGDKSTVHSASRLVQAVNTCMVSSVRSPDSQPKQRQEVQVIVRPYNINLPTQARPIIAEPQDNCSSALNTRLDHALSGSSEKKNSIAPTIVAIKCKPVLNRENSSALENLTSNSYVPKSQVFSVQVPHNGSASGALQKACRLSRSASVCSETGERKFANIVLDDSKTSPTKHSPTQFQSVCEENLTEDHGYATLVCQSSCTHCDFERPNPLLEPVGGPSSSTKELVSRSPSSMQSRDGNRNKKFQGRQQHVGRSADHCGSSAAGFNMTSTRDGVVSDTISRAQCDRSSHRKMGRQPHRLAESNREPLDDSWEGCSHL